MTTVTVIYDGGFDNDVDRRLRRMAVFQGGVELGSWCALSTPYRRYLAFQFVAAHRAQRFAAAVQRAVAHD